ncbi:MinD/ParA family protein [Bogoriella caseilytica]|uniref:Flp pilus assembly CpaE family ATPase n=1 Tax=Bogoriella caseilytica TaxID=56055 RepID=A0A3N2BBQ2_9MICO|nr:MinD/ParA family protein [Bogoriella caseilytica]ROR72670.1 Flp pilus assembly CpaE family ATPase [Bogoriella caseilytica]
MATKVLLVTNDAGVRDHLGHVLSEAEDFDLAGSVRDAVAARAALERDADITIMVVDENVDNGNGHAAARAVGAAFPLVGLVMVVPHAGSEAFGRAMEVGARSVISTSTSLDEVITRLEGVARWADSVRAALDADFASANAGRVVAIAGAKGGVGVSALTLLLARASVGMRSVSVVDFDLGKGDLAAYSGVHTRRSIVDLTGVAGEITSRMLRETSYEIRGGLRLLSAPSHGERGEEMTPEAARNIIGALRYESDLAVVDIGSHLDDVRATVLEFADAVLLVSTPDLPSLRATRRILDQWERLAIRPPSSVDLLLNRRAKQDQVTPALAERIVERSIAFVVPDGGAPFAEAMNTATLLEDKKTAVHEAVGRAGEAVLAKEITAEAEGEKQEGDTEVEQLLNKSAPTTRRSRRDDQSKRSRRRKAKAEAKAGKKEAKKSRKAAKAEAGQVALELPVMVGIVLAVVLIAVQGLGWAAGLVAARSAAQDGARYVGIQQSYDPTVAARAESIAYDGLLANWHSDATVTVGRNEVRVEIRTPTIIPGATLSAASTATVYREP